MKIAIALIVGFLLIEAGIGGKLGSMLGAIFDPASLTDTSTS